MPDYIFAYHGGKIPESDGERDAMMAAWGAWFEEIGPNIKDPGNPVGQSSTVSASGIVANGGSNPLAGYTIVTADSHAAAEAMAKGCPVVDEGGSVEVAEIVDVSM